MTGYSREQVRDAKFMTGSYAWVALTLFQLDWWGWEAAIAGSVVASLTWWHFHAYRKKEPDQSVREVPDA